MIKTFGMESTQGDKTTRSSKSAQKHVFHSAVKGNNLSFIKLLQKNGTDINARDENGKTALMWASRLGFDGVVEYLLKSGAELKFADYSGMTAVHEAALRGRLGALRLLAKYGADLEVETKSGQTPLHFASNGFFEVTKFLVDKGVDLFKRDCNGNTALHWSMSERKNDIEIIRLILDKGGEKMANDKEKPPIFTAVRGGHIKAFEYLKEQGASLLRTANNDATTLLHEATLYARIHIVSYLLNIGFEPDIRDGDGWTSLHVAATSGNSDLTILLLSSGADINAKTLKGSTPLKLAVLNKRQFVVEILVNNGADVNARDDVGCTILDVASKTNNLKTALYLADRGANFGHHSRANFSLNDKMAYLISIKEPSLDIVLHHIIS